MKSLSHVRPSVTPWTAAFQAPPSMGFARQEYWSGVPLLTWAAHKFTTVVPLPEKENLRGDTGLGKDVVKLLFEFGTYENPVCGCLSWVYQQSLSWRFRFITHWHSRDKDEEFVQRDTLLGEKKREAQDWARGQPYQEVKNGQERRGQQMRPGKHIQRRRKKPREMVVVWGSWWSQQRGVSKRRGWSVVSCGRENQCWK